MKRLRWKVKIKGLEWKFIREKLSDVDQGNFRAILEKKKKKKRKIVGETKSFAYLFEKFLQKYVSDDNKPDAIDRLIDRINLTFKSGTLSLSICLYRLIPLFLAYFASPSNEGNLNKFLFKKIRYVDTRLRIGATRAAIKACESREEKIKMRKKKKIARYVGSAKRFCFLEGCGTPVTAFLFSTLRKFIESEEKNYE